MQEYLTWKIIFHYGLLRFNPGDQPIESHKSRVAVLRKWSVMIFVKIRYETPISSVTCRHWKFHYITLSHPQQDLTCFERLTTMNRYNFRKWYVTMMLTLLRPNDWTGIQYLRKRSDDKDDIAKGLVITECPMHVKPRLPDQVGFNHSQYLSKVCLFILRVNKRILTITIKCK